MTGDNEERSTKSGPFWPRGSRIAIAYMVALGVVMSVVIGEVVAAVVIAIGLVGIIALSAALKRLIDGGKG